MDISQIWKTYITSLQSSTVLEYMAVLTGIASVWYSKKENVLLYPIGLISTAIYVYLSFTYQLIGEATVNFYYTVMSIIGWYWWVQKDTKQEAILHISYSNKKELVFQFSFFGLLFLLFFMLLSTAQKYFYEGAIPWADGFATATAFTGMYTMVKKKVESWYWWIATNIASIPLYIYKGLALTGTYYLVLFVIAFFGLAEWRQKAKK